jgi:FolB domain-containing protein
MIIKIKNLHLRAQIGIYQWEKNKLQDIVLNIIMNSPSSDQAGISDDIAHTLDYKKIRNEICELVESQHFGLIEKIAYMVAHHINDYYSIKSVFVEVDKPGALRFAESVSASYSIEK